MRMLAVNYVLTLGLLATLLCAPWPAAAQINRPHCDSCGRFIDKSPAQMSVTLNYNDHDRGVKTCSLFCLCELLEGCPDYTLLKVQIRNYPTTKDREPRYIYAEHSVFLFAATVGDEEKTSQPFTYAFADEKTAQQHQKELGGEVLEWEAAFDQTVKAAAEYEPPQPQPVHPAKRR